MDRIPEVGERLAIVTTGDNPRFLGFVKVEAAGPREIRTAAEADGKVERWRTRDRYPVGTVTSDGSAVRRSWLADLDASQVRKAREGAAVRRATKALVATLTPKGRYADPVAALSGSDPVAALALAERIAAEACAARDALRGYVDRMSE